MFRFALRKAASDIHEKVYSSEEIETEIKKHYNEFKNVAIFLKNINQLRFKKINPDGRIETIFDFKKQFLADKDEMENLNFNSYFKNSLSHQLMNIERKIFRCDLKISNLTIEEDTFYHIISQIGFENKLEINLNSYEIKNYFPLASIAIPINNDDKKFNGSLYCFLPLPIDSPMPYHINGYFALADESRQTLFKLSKSEKKFMWNQHLFNDIVSSLMIEGLIYMRHYLENKFIREPELMEMNYLKYFPSFQSYEKSNDPMNDLEKVFYNKLFAGKLDLVPIYENNNINNPSVEWINIKNTKSSAKLEKWFDRTAENRPYYAPICSVLIKYGFKVCSFLKLVSNLEKFYKKYTSSWEENIIEELNDSDISNFFRTYDEEIGLRINETSFQNDINLKNLIKFCLHGLKKISMLNGCSLLLNGKNEVTEMSSSKPIFKEEKYHIFAGCLEKFIHASLLDLNLDGFTKLIKIEDLGELLPFVIDKDKHYLHTNNLFNFVGYLEANEEILKKLDEFWRIVGKIVQLNDQNKTTYCKSFSNWAIIPVIFERNDKKIYLAPIESIDLVLGDKIDSEMPLVNEFNELNLPYLARRSLMALKNAVINLNTLGDLLEILNYLRWYDIDIIEKLKKKKRNNFLNYLINKLKQIDKKDKEFKVKKNQIMSLNLFENVFGEIMSIQDKTSIIIDKSIPLVGLDRLFPSNKYYLAFDDQEILKETLGIDSYNNIELYESFLALFNNGLSSEEKKIHLASIQYPKSFLNSLFEKLKKDDKNFNDKMYQIMSLNLFENVFGEIMSIQDKTSIIIDKSIPLVGLDRLFPSNKYYLAYDHQNILKKLNIKSYNLIEFYEAFLSDLNKILNFDEKLTHLILLQNLTALLPEKLIEKLKKFRFIKIKTGELLPISEFYDKSKLYYFQRYFNTMFPTAPYDADEWLKFLQRIGFKKLNTQCFLS